MKKFVAIILTAILTLSLFSCAEREEKGENIEISYNDGKYSGFSDIPDNYTVDDAINDGCLVIETLDDGTNVHGVEMRKTGRTEGYEHWVSFLEKSQNGEDAFLRVAHFIRGTGYYHDLYYADGKYTIFDFNEYGISEGESYSLLRRLDGMAGPVGNQKEAHYYVLTDSTELTYHDVSWSYLSSSISTITDIPFEWLGFMIYFDDDEENVNKKLNIKIENDRGKYKGFENIADGYSIKQAIDDGCMVIVSVSDTQSSVKVTLKNEIAEGYEYWQNFLEKSRRGEDTFLRTVHVMLGNVFVYDLYYSDGKYTVYELSYGEVSEGKEFSFLRRLDGMTGEKTEHIYVLTDDPTLTYESVKAFYYASSTLSPHSQSNFYWLIFLTNFEHEVENER